jgi:hypothetical protein
MTESEETKKEEKGEEQKAPEGNSDEGSKYETTPVIERAREEREKLEAANEKREALLDREEQIMAKRALGGTTEAGQAPEKKEESPEEYAKRVMSNSI